MNPRISIIRRQEGSIGFRTLIGTLIALAIIVGALLMVSRHEMQPAFREERTMMGTFIAITVAAPDGTQAKAEIDAAFDRIAELERALSSHDPASELNSLLARGQEGPVPVSEDLFRAIEAGVAWHAKTEGAFDVTVRPLLTLWKKCAEEDRPPTDEEIAEAMAGQGVARIVLDAEHRTVHFEGAVDIDLGGLGKGFTADAVARLMRERGVKSALIAVAGDIYALGGRPDGEAWHVGVQDPAKPGDATATITTLALRDRAVSTSGNYQRYDLIQGKRYSHIKDPRTGQAADNVPSVSVIGPNALTTDILGTALSVLGVDDGLALVAKMDGVEAMFIIYGEDGTRRIVKSSGFAKYEIGERAK